MRFPSSILARARAAAACLLLLTVTGCPGDSNGPADAAQPFVGVSLRVLVVDDAGLAAAAKRFTGEWTESTGGTFEVAEQTADDLDGSERLACDVVLYPSHDLAILAERNWLAPIATAQLDDPGLDWDELFPLPAEHETAWGPTTFAVPCGTPTFVCYARADLLKLHAREPPRTWAETLELAESLDDRGALGDLVPPAGLPWHPVVQPLGDGWAGLTLLAHAAPYAKHPSHYSALFDIETLEPLIDGPPFVRALEELVALHAYGTPEELDFGPAEVRREFWEGRAAFAFTWPTAAGERLRTDPGRSIEVAFAEMPGSKDVYDVVAGRWDERRPEDDPHVTLLGLGGRLGSIARDSKNPDAAFQLLVSLAGREGSARLAAASPATGPIRTSQLGSSRTWTEQPMAADAAGRWSAVQARALSRDGFIFALRLPGRDEYLAALDAAVQAAARGEQLPEDALSQVAEQWREITARRGAESQLRAYRRGLGLE